MSDKNTRLVMASAEEINEHTQELVETLRLVFATAHPPLVSIAAAVAIHCAEVPLLGDMLRRILAGETVDEVHAATSVDLDDGQLTHAPGAEA